MEKGSLDLLESRKSAIVRRFVPKCVVERFEDWSDADGDKQNKEDIKSACAVVAFVDISGFSTLANNFKKQERDRSTKRLTKLKDYTLPSKYSAGSLGAGAGAEWLAKDLNETLQKIVDELLRSGGDVIKFAGDALIVVWEDRPEDIAKSVGIACAAALRCKEMSKQHEKVTGESILSVHTGIGCGEILKCHVGGKFDRWEFSIAGDANTQATLAEAASDKDQVVISDVALAQLRILEECGAASIQTSSITKTGNFSEGYLRVTKVKLHDDHPRYDFPQGWDLEVLANKPMTEKVLGLAKAYIPRPVIQMIESELASVDELRKVTVIFFKILDTIEIPVTDLLGPEQALGPNSCFASDAKVGESAEERPFGGISIEDAKIDPEAERKRRELKGKHKRFLNYIHTSVKAVQEAAYSQFGTLRQFIVDDKGFVAIVAIGLPPHYFEDNAARAVKVAAHLIQTNKVRASAGICSGVVFCGAIGSKYRAEYSVTGECINLAARLMNKAEPNQVLCDESTSNEAKMNPWIKFKAEKAFTLKGYDAPVQAYSPELVAISTLRASTTPGEPKAADHQSVFGGPYRYRGATERNTVGQEEAKTDISQSIFLDKSSPAKAAFLEGSPGIGKTHMTHWAVRTCADVVSNVFYSAIPESDKAFNGWRSILTEILRLGEADFEAFLQSEAALAKERTASRQTQVPIINPTSLVSHSSTPLNKSKANGTLHHASQSASNFRGVAPSVGATNVAQPSSTKRHSLRKKLKGGNFLTGSTSSSNMESMGVYDDEKGGTVGYESGNGGNIIDNPTPARRGLRRLSLQRNSTGDRRGVPKLSTAQEFTSKMLRSPSYCTAEEMESDSVAVNMLHNGQMKEGRPHIPPSSLEGRSLSHIKTNGRESRSIEPPKLSNLAGQHVENRNQPTPRGSTLSKTMTTLLSRSLSMGAGIPGMKVRSTTNQSPAPMETTTSQDGISDATTRTTPQLDVIGSSDLRQVPAPSEPVALEYATYQGPTKLMAAAMSFDSQSPLVASPRHFGARSRMSYSSAHLESLLMETRTAAPPLSTRAASVLGARARSDSYNMTSLITPPREAANMRFLQASGHILESSFILHRLRESGRLKNMRTSSLSQIIPEISQDNISELQSPANRARLGSDGSDSGLGKLMRNGNAFSRQNDLLGSPSNRDTSFLPLSLSPNDEFYPDYNNPSRGKSSNPSSIKEQASERRQAIELVLAILDELGRLGNTLIVIDDAHNMDDASWELLYRAVMAGKLEIEEAQKRNIEEARLSGHASSFSRPHAKTDSDSDSDEDGDATRKKIVFVGPAVRFLVTFRPIQHVDTANEYWKKLIGLSPRESIAQPSSDSLDTRQLLPPWIVVSELKPLSLRESASFLNVHRNVGIGTELIKFIHDATNGNPGKFINLFDGLVDLEVVMVDPVTGVAQVIEGLNNIPAENVLLLSVPGHFVAGVVKRLDNLSQNAQILLKLASAFGNWGPSSLLFNLYYRKTTLMGKEGAEGNAVQANDSPQPQQTKSLDSATKSVLVPRLVSNGSKSMAKIARKSISGAMQWRSNSFAVSRSKSERLASRGSDTEENLNGGQVVAPTTENNTVPEIVLAEFNDAFKKLADDRFIITNHDSYVFRDENERCVIYNMILNTERCLTHQFILDWHEKQMGSSLEENKRILGKRYPTSEPGELGYHALLSEQYLKAFFYFEVAAQSAILENSAENLWRYANNCYEIIESGQFRADIERFVKAGVNPRGVEELFKIKAHMMLAQYHIMARAWTEAKLRFSEILKPVPGTSTRGGYFRRLVRKWMARRGLGLHRTIGTTTLAEFQSRDEADFLLEFERIRYLAASLDNRIFRMETKMKNFHADIDGVIGVRSDVDASSRTFVSFFPRFMNR